ncbi:hypothetical protein ES705_48246 [subsurface metagenome]
MNLRVPLSFLFSSIIAFAAEHEPEKKSSMISLFFITKGKSTFKNLIGFGLLNILVLSWKIFFKS